MTVHASTLPPPPPSAAMSPVGVLGRRPSGPRLPPPPRVQRAHAPSKAGPAAVWLHRHNRSALLLALGVANRAASQGSNAVMFFSCRGIDMLRRPRPDAPPDYAISSQLESSVEQGVRLVACTLSMSALGIEDRELLELPNLEFADVSRFFELCPPSASVEMF